MHVCCSLSGFRMCVSELQMDFVVPVSRHITNRKDERMKETHHQIHMPRFAAPSFTTFSFLIFPPYHITVIGENTCNKIHEQCCFSSRLISFNASFSFLFLFFLISPCNILPCPFTDTLLHFFPIH